MVNEGDPLYRILAAAVSRNSHRPAFHVHSTRSERVYRYVEEGSGAAAIGKFTVANGDAGQTDGEYNTARYVRECGFDSPPFYVPRPMASDLAIGLRMLSECVEGQDLDFYLRKAAFNADGEGLRHMLKRLAGFLHALHSRTSGGGDPLEAISGYGYKIVNKLQEEGVLNGEGAAEASRLVHRWMSRYPLQQAPNALVHGDATPTNFIFTPDGSVVAIDLEMAKRTDPVFDIGMVCGEIKHSFLLRNGSREASEPFIGTFLRSYCRYTGDRDGAFRNITARLPFFMGLTELRIARNRYLSFAYRQRLAQEGIACLQSGFERLDCFAE
jgi:hypothetical protein